MKLQEQLRKLILNFLLSETEGADPKNPDSHPDLDDWGPDSWWTFNDWKVWYNANVKKYGEIKARQNFARFWMAVEEGTGVGTKNDIDISWLKLNKLWHSTKKRVYTREEMIMYSPKEDKTTKKSTYEKKESDGFIVFVSGLQSVKNHQAQTNIFKNAFGSKYPIQSFNYADLSKIREFISKNKVIAVVLYSKGCELVSSLNFPKNKIYCIEPWNGGKNRSSSYSQIPSENMYIHSKIYARGAGTSSGSFVRTDNASDHFDALSKSAYHLSKRL